jgi:2-polyprenyl-3-methyl-5-hydroxy-6-metoxy-1,4-benzoquinol methylase
LIPFVSPGSSCELQRDGDFLVSDAGERFPIVNDIPRFVQSESYAAAFGLQWKLHARTQLDSHTGRPISRDRLASCLGEPVESLRGLEVLEAGCGAGRFTELLVGAGAQVHAVDLSQAVEVNRTNVGSQQNYVVAQADMRVLPFPPASFDLVLCLGVLQHLPSPEQGIKDLWAMVKPGGHLVIDHYRMDPRQALGKLTRLSTVYRLILRELSPARAKRITDRATDAFFPLHWTFRDSHVAQVVLNRVTPCPFYYAIFPEMTRDEHLEWSKLDTYDMLTDRYKHQRTVGQIRRFLTGLGAQEVWAVKGANGVQARARKPLSSSPAGRISRH